MKITFTCQFAQILLVIRVTDDLHSEINLMSYMIAEDSYCHHCLNYVHAILRFSHLQSLLISNSKVRV